jgi:hypothetical protein
MLQRTNKFEANWPSRTHWRKATCREVDCSHYVNGWVTRVAPGSPQDLYIRADTERHHKLERGEEFNYYTFEPGQRCYRSAQHRIKLDRGAWLTKNQLGREPGRLALNAMDYNQWTDEFNEEAYKANRR